MSTEKRLQQVGGSLTGPHANVICSQEINATVVLMKRNVLDFNDFSATISDGVDELLGQKIAFQLISSVDTDPAANGSGMLSSPAYLEDWSSSIPSLMTGESTYNVTFDWNQQEIGVPGAFIVKNFHHAEFYLKTLTLEDVPGHGPIHFICNSWVYPDEKYEKHRIFFSNQSYLPGETPAALVKYRNDELVVLRGNGTGELQEWDRVYDYALYNDLGDPDKGSDFVRPVLGGSSEYPYPRRGRTGRPPTNTDVKTEQRIPPIQSFNIYVPRDERFGHLKMSDFVGYGLKAIAQLLLPQLEDLMDDTPNEFDSFEDALKLYKKGIKVANSSLFKHKTNNIHLESLKQFLRCDGEGYFKFPTPQIIKENKAAWRTDEEFAREMLAGPNPVIIRRLEEFPPQSKLNPEVYGDHTSMITPNQMKEKLYGLTVDEAIKENRLFVLDYHDTLMPYLRRINTTSTKTYASRTLLFLQKDGTLTPLVIELSLPHPDGDEHGAISQVYTPAQHGIQGSIWQLAKAYVAVNDTGVHLLISHWLRTHCVIEPFVIASNRQLSVMHPIYKLLSPHFRDTMNINAFGRQSMINAGGGIEKAVFPGKFTMEMSAVIYKDWVFPEQALPADLIKRGMAVEDPNAPHGLRLLIEDYPFAVDGLEIWSAIRTWVEDYCKLYYKSNELIQNDTELQSWWKELREKGHGDKKDEPWWPKMQTLEDLVHSCTVVIWIASALHAAVNFGQYTYGGYHPNRPTMSRRFMPEPGTPEYEELKATPDKVFFRIITDQLQTLIVMSLTETLSRHASDEVYLGQRDTPEWTRDAGALEAFEKFGKKLGEIEKRIIQLNSDSNNRNRVGPVKIPYTLMYPSSEPGVTGKGIPNSASI